MSSLLLSRSSCSRARRLQAAWCLVVVWIGFSVPPAHAEAPKRHNVDISDLSRITAAHPNARELLEQAEGLLARGETKPAIELLAQASEEAPLSALIARRLCQALLEIGERDRALVACRRAVQREGSPLDLRALVRTILSGPNAPTFDELYEASMLTARAQKSMPRQPWGYAAACDIGRRLNDTAILDACRKDLQRVAPDHAETKRALDEVDGASSSIGVGLAWLLIVLSVVATLIDKLRLTNRPVEAALPLTGSNAS